MAESRFEFSCPQCGSPLTRRSPEEQVCPVDGIHYQAIDGIWRFLLPGRALALEQFIREYETVRTAEGRWSDDPAYYRALPCADLTGKFAADWRIRARSLEALVAHVIAPRERGNPLAVLDLGAGNGWLSYRLAQRNHHVAAIDLLTNPRDGLGAHVYYDKTLTLVQAEFDCLPFANSQFDVAIFNSSLHYAVQYESTLQAALRVLVSDGTLVILDTPIYRNAASGKQMVAEREAQFKQAYGFASNALASENFLTYKRLDELGHNVGVDWEWIRSWRGWRWAARPWLARMRGQREPAEFLLIMGRRKRS